MKNKNQTAMTLFLNFYISSISENLSSNL